MKIEVSKPLKLLIGNKLTIDLAKNPISHGRSKHIKTRFHFIRHQVNKGKLELVFCPSELQLVDILTKGLRVDRFEELRKQMDVVSFKNLD